jgi:hypothetical protein
MQFHHKRGTPKEQSDRGIQDNNTDDNFDELIPNPTCIPRGVKSEDN